MTSVFVLSHCYAGHLDVIDVLPYLVTREGFPLLPRFQSIAYGGFFPWRDYSLNIKGPRISYTSWCVWCECGA